MFGLTHELSPELWPACPDAPAFLRLGHSHSAVALLELPPGQSPIEDHKGAHFAMRVHADQFESARDGGLEALARTSATHPGQRTDVEYYDYGPQKSLVSAVLMIAGRKAPERVGGRRRRQVHWVHDTHLLPSTTYLSS